MNLDDVMGAWRSHDLSPLFGVDQTLLHQVLRQEQARAEKQLRRMRWFMNVVTVVLLITAALFLAIMIDPKDDDVLVVWDYVVGIVGVVAAIVLAGALFALRRSRRVRDQGFDDSFRDHLRRHISQLDDESVGERRLALIVVAATLVCGSAISIAGHRINDVPWGEFDWSPLPSVLILLCTYLVLFRWIPRARSRNLARKRSAEPGALRLTGLRDPAHTPHMPKFLIEVPHDPGAQPCARAMKVLLETGTHWLTNADFGCLDGVHKAWLTIDVESHVEAQMLLPPAFRRDATIVRLCKFDDLITKHEGL